MGGGLESVPAQRRSSAVKLHKSRRDDTRSRVYITSGGKRRRGDEKGGVCFLFRQNKLKTATAAHKEIWGSCSEGSEARRPVQAAGEAATPPRTAWHLGNLWHFDVFKRGTVKIDAATAAQLYAPRWKKRKKEKREVNLHIAAVL